MTPPLYQWEVLYPRNGKFVQIFTRSPLILFAATEYENKWQTDYPE